MTILHLFSYSFNLKSLSYLDYLSDDYEYIIVDLQKVFTSRYHTITRYSPLTSPNNRIKVIRPKNFIELKALFDRYPNALIFKSFTDKWQDLYIHLLVQNRQRILLTYAHSSNIANAVIPSSQHNFGSVLMALANNFFNRLYFLFFLILSKFRLIPRVDTLFSTGKGEIITAARYNRINDFCFVNDLSYDRYVAAKPKLSNDYIVFIAQNFPYATYDLKSHGEPPIQRDVYTSELLLTLRYLEEIYDKKTVICAHPKYDISYREKDFGPFEVIQGDTEELIQKAHLVVGHFSAGLNYAVLLNKPILLLRSTLFSNNPWVETSIQGYAALLGAKTHYMGNPISLAETNLFLSIDQEKYIFFIQNFISIYYPEKITSSDIIKRYMRVKYTTNQRNLI